MKISYNTLDSYGKQFKLIDGVYIVEHDRFNKWMWTSTEFSGVITNVNYVIFGLISNVKNQLIYEDKMVDINESCLNLVKIDTINKSDFKFKLDKPYEVPKEQRILGVKIVSINIDGDVIF